MKATYEIMRPETVGWASNTLVLGKHSGKHAYRQRLNELGYNDLKPDQIEKLVDEFKKLADEKRVVTDADIEAIISDELFKPDPVWILKDVHVTAGNVLWPTATVCLKNVRFYVNILKIFLLIMTNANRQTLKKNIQKQQLELVQLMLFIRLKKKKKEF